MLVKAVSHAVFCVAGAEVLAGVAEVIAALEGESLDWLGVPQLILLVLVLENKSKTTHNKNGYKKQGLKKIYLQNVTQEHTAYFESKETLKTHNKAFTIQNLYLAREVFL